MKIGRSVSSAVAAHSALTTGIHGVGASTVCSLAEATALVTREFFVPIYGGTDIVEGGALIDLAGEFAVMTLIVPQDFSAITNLEVIFRPLETGASMNFVVTTRYGAYNGGESYTVHTENADPRDIGPTVTDENLAHSIIDLVDIAALVAGDRLVVWILYDAAAIDSNAYVLGIRLRYT